MARIHRYSPKPSLRIERTYLGENVSLIAGMDEVGRGALAGPVTVGVAVVAHHTRTAPVGLRDSKLLTPAARTAMVPRVQRWALDHAVGHASSWEIDQVGIIAALRLAGHRALARLGVIPDLVILDGNHNYLRPPSQSEGTASLFEDDALVGPPVVTLVKADMRCSSVAAASVLAKTTRDCLMVQWAAEHAGYEWEVNKGYAAPAHLDALRRLGPSPLHRVSWRLPTEAVGDAGLPTLIPATVEFDAEERQEAQ